MALKGVIAEFNYQRYHFIFLREFPYHVDIRADITSIGYSAWLHEIKDGKVVLRNDIFLSKDAEQFINRVIGMMVLM